MTAQHLNSQTIPIRKKVSSQCQKGKNLQTESDNWQDCYVFHFADIILLVITLTCGLCLVGTEPQREEELGTRTSSRPQQLRRTETPSEALFRPPGFNIPGQTAKWLSASDIRMGKVLIKNLSELVFPRECTESFAIVLSHIRVMYQQSLGRLVALLQEYFPFMINKFHRTGYFYLRDFSQ